MMPPKTIRVGPFEYEIRWMDSVTERDMKAFGLCNTDSQVITLSSDRKRQRVAVSFLHEILHAMTLIYGVSLTPEGRLTEEDAVAGFSLGMADFWKSNPDAAEWWRDLIQRAPSEPMEDPRK